jgi:alkanesulfonate monooxygenase SsuD/methylene tetrahydromethanopterin reductase-like flavin-dependent oxidoreductase (luciferase family)
MLKAWTSDAPWSHRGKYWQFENVVVEPPTAQKPHPPLWMGAGRPASIKKVAAYGYNMLLDQFAPVDQIGERIALFKSEVEARGQVFDPMSVAVTRSIYVAMTEAERHKALETRLAARRRMERLAQRPDGQNKASIMSYADTLEAAAAGALYGTPDEIAAKLQALRGVGAEYVLLNSAGGPESLRRFAREVLPAFAGAPVLSAAS